MKGNITRDLERTSEKIKLTKGGKGDLDASALKNEKRSKISEYRLQRSQEKYEKNLLKRRGSIFRPWDLTKGWGMESLPRRKCRRESFLSGCGEWSVKYELYRTARRGEDGGGLKKKGISFRTQKRENP